MEAYKKAFLVSTILAAVLILAMIFYFFYAKPSAPQEADEIPGLVNPISSPAVSSGEEQRESITIEKESPLPQISDIQLNSSDKPVRELANECSTHPEFHQWLKNKNLIRRCVAIIDNVSNGTTPAPHLQFLLPKTGFKVIRKNGKIILDPASYIRYQQITMVLVSLDSEKFAKLYYQLMPVLDEAYRELGYPSGKFQEALEHTLDLLLKTPIPQGDILLEEKITTYAFEDPQLEALDDARKHFLRMGPQNVKALKAKFKEIKEALKNVKEADSPALPDGNNGIVE